MTSDEVRALIVDVPDFPQPGIVFKDLTPVLGDYSALRWVTDELAAGYADAEIDHVVGVEARGFVLGAPVALALGVGFVPVRKHGKLPREVVSETYDLEYGTATLDLHADAFADGGRVLIIDDVLATGGTARATLDLVRRCGGEPVGFGFVVELDFLGGRSNLDCVGVLSLLRY